MACGCKSGSKSSPQTIQVVLPGGAIRSYSSPIAAQAKVESVPGAYIRTSS